MLTASPLSTCCVTPLECAIKPAGLELSGLALEPYAPSQLSHTEAVLGNMLYAADSSVISSHVMHEED